jgi:hypothetical protein
MAAPINNESNQRIVMKLLMLAIIISELFLANISLAANSKTAAKATSLSYSWHDERGEHHLALKPDLVAEFSPRSSSNIAITQPLAESHKASRGNTQVWKIIGETAEQTMQKSRSSYPSGKYSEVFEEGGQLRALPGNIIVRFKPDWTAYMIQNWLQAQQLTLQRKLEIGINTYLIKSEPGITSLNLANRIHNSGDVLFAQPDWWEEISTK